MTTQSIDIDIREDYLENHWADEAKCEAVHDTAVPPCSKVVTHRVSLCVGAVLTCEAAGTFAQKMLDESIGCACMFCGRPVTACWRVVKI